MKELDETFYLMVETSLYCTYRRRKMLRNIVIEKQSMYGKYGIIKSLLLINERIGISHSLGMQYQNLSDLVDY